MDYASLSASVLAEKRPDLVAEIGAQAVAKIDLDAARAAGAAAERDRIVGVRAAALPGHEKLIETLAFDGKTTPAEAALAVIAAERGNSAAAAAARAADAPKPVESKGDAVDDKPEAKGTVAGPMPGTLVEASRAKLDADAKAYMAAHPGTDYLSAIKAIQKGA